MPVALLSSTWIFGILIFNILPSLYAPSIYATTRLFFYIFISSVGYAIGGMIKLKVKFGTESDANYQTLKIILNIIFTILVVLALKLAYEIVNYGNISEYFFIKRVEALSGDGDSSIFLGQFYPFCIVFTLLYMSYCRSYAKKFPAQLISSALLLLFLLGSEGGRSVSLLYLIIIFFLVFITNRLGAAYLFKPAMIVVAVFLASSYFMRTSEAEKEAGGVVESLVNQLIAYVFGSAKSYDIFLTDRISIFHIQLNSMLSSQPPFQMDFVDIGNNVSTNVFSAFSVYEYYFGYVGSCIFVFCLFLLLGTIYSIKSRPALMNGIKAILLACVFLMVFHDYFFAIYPYFVRYIIIYILLDLLAKSRFKL